jgi:hypothetical protein
MSERTTNIQIGGGNIGGLQIGDNNQQTITQTNGEQVPTVPQVFDAIKRALPTIDAGMDSGEITSADDSALPHTPNSSTFTDA